jgi:hypothetical protein
VEDTKTKWRDFEVETLIALRGEMDDEFAKKQTNKVIFFPHDVIKLCKKCGLNVVVEGLSR